MAKTKQPKWYDFHYSIKRNTNAVPILKFIDENIINEYLSYNETLYYDAPPTDGPLRVIEFKAPAFDPISIFVMLTDKFPNVFMTGGSHEFKWSHKNNLSNEVIKQIRKLEKEHKIK